MAEEMLIRNVVDSSMFVLQVIAGKGHETYQITKGEKDYFDDREECREALLHMEELQIYFDTSELPFK